MISKDLPGFETGKRQNIVSQKGNNFVLLQIFTFSLKTGKAKYLAQAGSSNPQSNFPFINFPTKSSKVARDEPLLSHES